MPRSRRASAWGVAIAASLSLSSPPARAAEPTRLEWVRLEGAGSCIDSAELEARVKRRLGNDPFDPRATRSIEGVVRRTGSVWRAQIAVRAHPDDPSPPLRELESHAEDCESLSNAAVLAVALAVDPAAALSDAPAPAPAREPPPPPSEPAKPLQPAAPSTGLAGRANPWAVAQIGLLPRASPGVGVGAAATLGPRIELGIRAAAFPEVQVTGDPSFAIGLDAFDLELCVATLRAASFDLRACGGPSFGILHAAVLAGNRTQPGERGSVAAELGLDGSFAVSRSVALALGARAVAPVTRYHFTLEGSNRSLFDQAAVSAMAFAGIELRLGRP